MPNSGWSSQEGCAQLQRRFGQRDLTHAPTAFLSLSLSGTILTPHELRETLHHRFEIPSKINALGYTPTIVNPLPECLLSWSNIS